MSSLPTPKNAILRLLEMAIAKETRDGLASLQAVLSLMENDEELRPSWNLRYNNSVTPLWQAALKAIAPVKHPQNGITMQRMAITCQALYQQFKAAGLDVSASGPVMTYSMGLGLAEMLRARDKDVPLELDQFNDYLNGDAFLSSEALAILAKEWKCHPVLRQVIPHLESLVQRSAWLDPKASIPKISQSRAGRPWTSDEADLYLRQVVVPNWNTLQVGSGVLRVFFSTKMTSDHVCLAQRVSAQGWASVLYSQNNSINVDFLAQIYKKLYENGKPKFLLDIPSPTPQWMGEFIASFPKGATRQPPYNRILIEFARSIFDGCGASNKLDWEILGQGIHANYLGKGIPVLPAKIISWLGTQLENDLGMPTREEMPNEICYAIALASWARMVPQKDFYASLPSWEKLHKPIEKLHHKISEEYHSILAQSLFIRLASAHDSQENLPVLASVFWTHLLRSNSSTISGLLRKINKPSRVDMYDIDKTNSKLLELLCHPSDIVEMKSPEDKADLRRSFLTLKSAVMAPTQQASVRVVKM